MDMSRHFGGDRLRCVVTDHHARQLGQGPESSQKPLHLVRGDLRCLAGISAAKEQDVTPDRPVGDPARCRGKSQWPVVVAADEPVRSAGVQAASLGLLLRRQVADAEVADLDRGMTSMPLQGTPIGIKVGVQIAYEDRRDHASGSGTPSGNGWMPLMP